MNSELLNIKSKHIELRPATREDVPLIFELRRSERGSWLNTTSGDIALQYEYFERYLDRFLEGSEIYYVIIDRVAGEEVGIFRLTQINEEYGFGWEGLVMKPNNWFHEVESSDLRSVDYQTRKSSYAHYS